MKTVSAGMIQALRSPDRRICVIAEADWPTGIKRLWTGVGDLVWRGERYAGVGALVSVTGLQLTGAVGIQQVDVKFASVPGDEVIDIPTSSIQGRTARIWLACLTPLEQVIPDPYLLATLTMSHATWKFGEDGTASLSVSTTAGIWQHEAASNRVWSDEEQQSTYPGDTGFVHMASVAGQALKWSKT